jgi:hypothetical protein
MTAEQRDAIINDARARIEQAIYDIIRTGEHETPFLLGWVVGYELTTAGLEDGDQTADGVIAASDSQSRATSRGLFELGADRYGV